MLDRIRVLHVDDDPAFADLAATYLEREDDRIRVETATDADDGLDRLADEFDCVVSDYDMPGTNGIEFLETVRETHPDLPFILYTGKGSEEVASEAISAGVTDYLQKRSGTEQYALLANRLTNAVEQAQARRQADEHHRVSTVVREINRALVEATSRDEIGDRVCRILTDADPYVFAWIGTVDESSARVEPQATAGVEDGYLDAVTVTTDDSTTGRGPGGTALRENRITVSQNIQHDEMFEPWREQALDRGYRAVAAIPLSHDGTRYGLLAVYADRPNAFDEAERDLLAELGDTVGQAYHRLDLQRQYEDQYRDLFEAAPVMFAFTREVDGDPVVEDCNRLFAETLGYSREELRGTKLETLYSDESAKELTGGGGYDRALAGEFVREQRDLITRDGEVVTVLLRATPRRNSEGAVVGTHALFVDVSEQTLVQTLEDRRQRTAFALDATDSVLFERDLESGQVRWLGPFERLYGVPPDQLGTIEAFYEACVHPADRDRIRRSQAPDALAEADGSITHDFRTHPDRGERRWIHFEGYVSTDANGDPRRLVGLTTDTTERTERERDLQRYREYTDRMLDAIDDVVFVYDEHGVPQRWNESFAEVTGYDDDELPSMTGTALVPPEYRETAAERIAEAFETGHGRLEAPVLAKDGTTTPYEYVANRVEHPDGDPRLVGIGRDITERKEQERRLERKNERLSVLFDRFPEPAFAYAFEDGDPHVREVNEAFEETFGYDAADAVGAHVDDLIVPPDRRAEAARVDERVRNGDAVDELLRRQASDGLRTFRFRNIPLSDDGDIDGYAIYADVTERVRREAQLEAEQQRFQTLFEQLTQPVVEVEYDGLDPIVVDVNPAFEETFGYDADDIVGESLDAYIVPEDRRDEADDINEHVRQGGRLVSREVTRLTADGPREFLLENARYEDGSGGFAVYTDVSVRKRREEALSTLQDATRAFMEAEDTQAVAERAVETARTVLDMPINGLWLHDAEENVLQPVSKTAEADELLGEAPTYTPGESLSWQAFRDGELSVYDDLRTEPDRLVEDTAIRSEIIVPLGDHGVMNVGATEPATFSDIDISLVTILGKTVEAALTRADREQQLRSQRAQLERQNDRLEQFTRVVSHDLKNPLNLATAGVELARSENDVSHLDDAAAGLERMETLITDLLTIAREGREVQETEATPLSSLARTCWSRVASPDATLQVDTDRTIRADPGRLEQLLENLLGNAVRHGGPDVTVTIDCLADGFYVADDGPGISPDDRDEVFDTGYSTSADGTGFGLNIVREIVEAHGWRIDLIESDDGGARFEITGVDVVE